TPFLYRLFFLPFRIFVKFYLNLLCKSCIVFSENSENFRAAELMCNFFACRKHLSQLGAAEEYPVIFPVRTGLHRGHPFALIAVEGPVDVEWFGFECVLGNLVEDLLSIERAVILT